MTASLTPTRSTNVAAESEAPAETGSTSRRRLLVVVDQPCTAPDLCASVRRYAGADRIDALVIAPAHGLPDTQWYVDEDAARADATHRLRACVACLAADGIRASGRLTDPDPVQAIADALYAFPADEILIVTAPQRPSNWLHQNVVDRARRRFGQPIAHIAMPTRANRGGAVTDADPASLDGRDGDRTMDSAGHIQRQLTVVSRSGTTVFSRTPNEPATDDIRDT